MAFQNDGLWVAKNTGCLNDIDIACDNSMRIEPKRALHWFAECQKAELLPNKKQAVGVPTNDLFSGMINSNASPWNNAPGYQPLPAHFPDCLFNSQVPKTVNFADQDSTSVGSKNPSFGSSIFNMPKHPSLGVSYSGIRKVKVSQVRDNENPLPISMEHVHHHHHHHHNRLGKAYGTEDESLLPSEPISIEKIDGSVSMDAISRNVSIAQTCENDELLMNQPSVHISEIVEEQVGNSSSCVTAAASAVPASVKDKPATKNTSKRKEEDQNSSGKVTQNTFPSNVRSLLSTGIFDGVPVKYIAYSREKELSGVIKGSGYLCGCEMCNFSKVINAYEFERHASCKTKHPNSHICFENGKTIYGIVQELRSTPPAMLFEVIQSITGSPLHPTSFKLWKESYLAATRELQRIYGRFQTDEQDS